MTFLTILLLILTAPLVFQAKKDVLWSEEYTEIATFSAEKYQRIRVVVTHTNTKYSNFTQVFGVDETGRVLLDSSSTRDSYTQVFDTPPARVMVRVRGEGTYYLKVYGFP